MCVCVRACVCLIFTSGRARVKPPAAKPGVRLAQLPRPRPMAMGRTTLRVREHATAEKIESWAHLAPATAETLVAKRAAQAVAAVTEAAEAAAPTGIPAHVPHVMAQAAFHLMDKDGNGKLSRAEVIQALRKDATVRKVLGLPAVIRQEDGTRDRFEEVFQAMDTDGSKAVPFDEFARFLGAALPAGRVDDAETMQARLPASSTRAALASAPLADGAERARTAGPLLLH